MSSHNSNRMGFTDVLQIEMMIEGEIGERPGEQSDEDRSEKCSRNHWKREDAQAWRSLLRISNSLTSRKFQMIVLKEEKERSRAIALLSDRITLDKFHRWMRRSWIAWRLKLSSTLVNGQIQRWMRETRNRMRNAKSQCIDRIWNELITERDWRRTQIQSIDGFYWPE